MIDVSSPLVSTSFVTLYNPLQQPPSFVGLELVFLTCAVLTLVHAVRAYRAGDASRLFSWACIFTYGILIEILCYNFLDNFTHGQFTVMFYHRKLPLYVSVLYPVYIYSALYTVGRYGLNRWAEPFAVGLVIVLLDVPFDILGPDAGWWSWSPEDPNLAYRWHGVPVTSYYWHLAFGGVMAFLTRTLRGFVTGLGPWRWKLLLALPVALATLVLGVVAFLPFHGLKALGVADGRVVAGLFMLSALVFLVAGKERALEPDPPLRWIPVVYYPFFLALALLFWSQGTAPDRGEKLAVILGAAAAAAVVQIQAHRARAGSEGVALGAS